jgi:isoleucyl-tRNA synthetase
MLMVDGQAIQLTGEDVLVQTESRGGLAVASDKGVTVAVDTALTPELVQEGYARDLVRTINNMRKEAGLDIADRIHLAYQASGDVAAALANFADYIQQETLAVTLAAGQMAELDYQQTLSVGDQAVNLSLRKAA